MSTGKIKLSHVINELSEERSMEKETLIDAVVEGILLAYQGKFPHFDLSAKYNRKDDELSVFAKKTIVSSVKDGNVEISTRKARSVDPQLVEGEEIEVPFDEKIGRIEILKARQFIAQKIRTIEAEAVFKEFEDKKGRVVGGTVHKVQHNGAVVLVYDIHAFLPKSAMIGDEKLLAGSPVRVLINEVFAIPRGDYQVFLDRASVEFVQGIFELEIPEVFDGVVKIEKIVRYSGYKTKILVSSSDPNIDPVGTCVGVGGVRIKPVLKEMGTEKVDIVPLVHDDELQVARALKPAVVDSVEIIGGVAHVKLPDDQRSSAIGRSGKNIALASKLTGFEVKLEPPKGDGSSLGVESIFSDSDKLS